MAHGSSLTLSITQKRFADHGVVLENFALSITSGSVVALWGPSGIGKSTLLRLMGGIDGDYTGTITVDGTPATEAPPPGYVFQDPRLLPWLTALDNVALAGADFDHCQTLLTELGLGDAMERFPHQLSGGMQRRVALARALVGEPRLLLLDEPFVSLDAALVADMKRVVSQFAQRTGASVVFTSHSAEDVAQLAERVIVLDGKPARIRADATFEIPPQQRGPAEIAAYAQRFSGPANPQSVA